VTTAVNIPAISHEDMELVGPFLPLCQRLGRLAIGLAELSSIERLEVEYLGRIAERDTRLLTVAALNGVLRGHTEEDVNYVNAPAIAAERRIDVSERRDRGARDFTDLVRITVVCGDQRTRVVGTTLGRQHRPHLLEAWGQRFNLQLDDDHLVLFRYSDKPGMIGRVGSIFGAHGVNIAAAAVGRRPPEDEGNGRSIVAVMAVTTDGPVPAEVIAQIVDSEGFLAGRAVSL
jgi:D-3-phosphoglycerate dehydrogenase